jgi:DNA polymerase-3 subunit beta
MQLRIDKADLQEALTLTRGATATDNPTNVMYESVMFEACQDGVWVNATDGTIWSRVLVGATVKGWDPVMIKSAQLTDIVTGLDDGELEIKFDRSQATLTSGRYSAKFGAANAMEFPAMPRLMNDCQLVSVKANKLIEMIRATIDSADTRIDRPYLNGVHFSSHEGDLQVVGLDGHRVAISKLTVPSLTAEAMVGATGTAGQRLARQWASLADLRPIDNSVSFGFQDGWGFMVGKDAMIAGLLPDQRFPDFRNTPLFPRAGDDVRIIRLDRKTLAKSAKRVCAIGAKLKGAIALDIEARADGKVWLMARASGKDAEDMIEGQTGHRCGEGMFSRRVGGDLFQQALSNIKGDEVSMFIPAHDQKPMSLSNIWKEPGDIFVEHYLMPRS